MVDMTHKLVTTCLLALIAEPSHQIPAALGVVTFYQMILLWVKPYKHKGDGMVFCFGGVCVSEREKVSVCVRERR